MKRYRLDQRGAGLLLHPTSLPGPFESGDLGPSAHAFVDFVAKAGLGAWQVLPLGPVGHGHSPYASTSCFAGSPALISLERLQSDALLDAGDPALVPAAPSGRADLGAAKERRLGALRRAFERTRASQELWTFVEQFREKNAYWLDDFANFSALKRLHDNKPFLAWPEPLRKKDSGAVSRFLEPHAREHEFECFLQARFDYDLRALIEHAHQQGVGLIGDAPIYVALDSAEVWAHPELFQLDEERRPRAVAGVPPDAFSDDGQLWGNPLYDWDYLEKHGFGFWVARIEHELRRVDALRLDHFIGFSRYYAVASGETSAKNGKFFPVPGYALFEAVFRALGAAQLLAEDLGVVTDEVRKLRDHFKLPGMNVMQFSFSPGQHAESSRPHHFATNSCVYTGTHDNDTTAGWLGSPPSDASADARSRWEADRDFALKYVGLEGQAGKLTPAEQAWVMVREAFKNQAVQAILPVQDLLGLGREARMNRPGIADGNWDYRLLPGALDDDLASRVRALAETYGRLAAR